MRPIFFTSKSMVLKLEVGVQAVVRQLFPDGTQPIYGSRAELRAHKICIVYCCNYCRNMFTIILDLKAKITFLTGSVLLALF